MMQKMASVICGCISTVSEVLLYSLILSLCWYDIQVAGRGVRKSVQIKYFLFQLGALSNKDGRLQMREH